MASGQKTIQDLIVRMSADLSRMQRDMERADRVVRDKTGRMEKAVLAVEKRFKSLDRTASRMSRTFAAIGAAVAVRQMNALTGAALKNANALQDQADKLGLTTTALQEYRFAGEQVGIAQTQTDMALQRFLRRVGEAKQGMGTLLPVFKQYGIQLHDSNGNLKTGEQLLRDFADAMAQVSDSNERLRMGMAAFDSEGIAFNNVIDGGSQALDTAAAKAQRYGAVMDEHLVRKAAEANSRLEAMRSSLRATFDAALLDPLLNRFGDFDQAMLASRDLARDAGKAIGETMLFLANTTTVLADNIEIVKAAFAGWIGLNIGKNFGPWGAAIGLVAGALLPLAANAQTTNDLLSQQAGIVRDLEAAQLAAASSTDALSRAQLELSREAAEKQIADLEKRLARTRQARDAIGNSDAFAEGTAKAIVDYARANERVRQLEASILELSLNLQNIVVIGRRTGEVLAGSGGQTVEVMSDIERSVVDLRAQVGAFKAGGEDELLRVTDLQDARDMLKSMADQTGLTVEEVAAWIAEQRELNAELDAFNERRKKELDQQRQLTEATEKNRERAVETVAEMRQQLRVLELQNAGQEELAEQLQFEYEMRQKLGDAYAENAAELEELRLAREEEREIAEERAREEEEMLRRAEEQVRQWQELWNNAARSIQSSLSNAFRDALDGNIDSFKDFGKSILNIMKDVVAQIAAMMVFQPVLGNILGGVGGAGGGAGGGAAGALNLLSSGGGLVDLLSNGLPTLSQIGEGIGAAAHQLWSFATSPVGMGLAGYGLSSLAFDARRGPGNEIGAAAGTWAGAALTPILGPLGPLIGSFAGSAIGGLIGPKPSRELEGFEGNLLSGELKYFDEDPDNGRGASAEASEAIANSIRAIAQTIVQRTGASLTGLDSPARGFDNHFAVETFLSRDSSRTPTYRIGLGGNVSGSGTEFSSQQEAVAFAGREIARSLGDIPAQLKADIEAIDFGQDLQQALGLVDFAVWLNDLETGGSGEQLGAIAQAFADLEAQMPDLQRQLEGIGRSVDDAAGIMEDAKRRIVDNAMAPIRDELARLRDPEQYELDQLDAWRDEWVSQVGLTQQDILDIEELYGIRRQEIVDRYSGQATEAFEEVIDSATEAAEAQAEAARLQENMANAVIGQLNDQIALRREEMAVLQQTSGVWSSVRRSALGVRDRLTFDARLSTLSGEGRLDEAMRQLEEAFAAGQAGDVEQAQRALELAVIAAEANAELNASSGEAAAISERIRQIVDNTDSIAGRHLTVSEMSLSALQDVVALLERDVAAVASSAAAPGPTGRTAAEYWALQSAYADFDANMRAGGAGDLEIINSGAFGVFRDELFDILGGLSDVALLNDVVGSARVLQTDPHFGNFVAHGADIEAVASQRLAQLGINPPSRAIGGATYKGTARVHANETLYIGPQAHVMNTAQSKTALVEGGQVLGVLREHTQLLGMIAGVLDMTGEGQMSLQREIGVQVGRLGSVLEGAGAGRS